jgi:hypothetical protein
MTFCAALLPICILLQGARAGNLPVVSDTTWQVYDASGHIILDSQGNPALAQNVCLSSTSPNNCPAGATQYGYPYPAWTTDLSSLPGATWIWAPSITGATFPAAHAKFTFGKALNLPTLPPVGIPNVDFWIAADNTVEQILINNNSVTIPPAPAPGPTSSNPPLLHVPIPASYLRSGSNFVKITVSNGDDPSDCVATDAYNCNPAGVVFGATIPFQGNAPGDPGSCLGVHGGMFSLGGIETLDCPAQTHKCVVQPEGSVGWGPTTGTCVAATCSDNIQGKTVTFQQGAKEMVACPSGLAGAGSKTCGDGGKWGSSDFSTCACTGSDGMTPFLVGTTETVPCPFPTTQGTKSHTCQLTPVPGWNGPPAGACSLPAGIAGGVCGGATTGDTATCPSGTTCGSRTSAPPPRPGWCGWLVAVAIATTGGVGALALPSECSPKATTSTTFFCDPP